MSKIKAVIYDVDDLMVDSYALHVEASEKALERYGHRFDELPEELRSHFVGRRVIDNLKDTVAYLKLDVDPEVMYQERLALFHRLVREKLEARPGLQESMTLFRRHNLRLAIASSGAGEYLDAVLEKFNLAGYFEVIISGGDVQKGKPDPETYLVAVQKLGLTPAECLVLEDAKNGVESAKAAGCKCIAIRNPNTPVQDHSGADKVLNSLSDVTIEMVESL